MDYLIELGALVRKAGRHSRLRKADMCFERVQYQALEKHLQLLLQSRAVFNDDPTTQEVLERTKRSELRPEQQALINANLVRRHRFTWSTQRSRKLQVSGQVAFARTQSRIPEENVSDNIRPAPKNSLGSSYQTLPSQKTATTYNKEDLILPDRLMKREGDKPKLQSDRSVEGAAPAESDAGSTMITSTAVNQTYPHPPAVVKMPGKRTFVCPCCREVPPIAKATKRRRWRSVLGIEDSVLC
jgi:hypothetical protein